MQQSNRKINLKETQMRFYTALDGTCLDLDHIIAVRMPYADRPWGHFFKVECAFGTKIEMGGDSAEEAEKLRNHLLF